MTGHVHAAIVMRDPIVNTAAQTAITKAMLEMTEAVFVMQQILMGAIVKLLAMMIHTAMLIRSLDNVTPTG